MRGVDIFREHFIGFEHFYVIIGGTACTLLLNEMGGDFRATKDFDIVLLVENIGKEFAEKFWKFIENGHYQNRFMSQTKGKFYRFEKPKNDQYPFMIELFSRAPVEYEIVSGSHLIPLHIDDDISSLSAILLNDDYYKFLQGGKKMIDGISLLDEFHLIPFKAKAWCELTDRQLTGEEGLGKHIKKHKKDIAVLLTLITTVKRVTLDGMVLKDMIRFENEMKSEELTELTTGIKNMTTQSFCLQLKDIYNL